MLLKYATKYVCITDPDTNICPSAEYAQDRTGADWPVRVWASSILMPVDQQTSSNTLAKHTEDTSGQVSDGATCSRQKRNNPYLHQTVLSTRGQPKLNTAVCACERELKVYFCSFNKRFILRRH